MTAYGQGLYGAGPYGPAFAIGAHPTDTGLGDVHASDSATASAQGSDQPLGALTTADAAAGNLTAVDQPLGALTITDQLL